MTKRIPLTQGKSTIVDDDDYEKFGKFKWQAVRGYSNGRYSGGFYAERGVWINNSTPRKILYLSREIMNAPRGSEVDHINHDTLDNRKENLRICSHAENMRNRYGAGRNSKSGIRGVGWDKHSKMWRARISFNGKLYDLGSYKNQQEAQTAYWKANEKYFGQYGGGR